MCATATAVRVLGIPVCKERPLWNSTVKNGETIMFRIRLAIGVFIACACLGGFAGEVLAADTDATATAATMELQEIVVTGSSIAQKLDSSSLPVTLLSSEEIAKTGFTSATDLLQNLPGMQGFVPSSSSVNGAGDGISTAAVHGLPSKYTLVLLDGQRVAGFELSAVAGEGLESTSTAFRSTPSSVSRC